MAKYILILVLAVFLQPLFSFSLPLLVLGWSVLKLSARRVYLMALISGLAIDLLSGRLLGITAIFFLLGSFLIVILTERFKKSLFLIIFTIAGLEFVYILLLPRLGY